MKLIFAALGIAVAASAGLSVTPAEAVRVAGTKSYTKNCEWICHPRIKKARAQTCQNKAGKRKMVYWERMPVPCDPTLGD